MIESIKALCEKISISYNMEGSDSLEIYIDFIPNDIETEEEFESLRQFSGHNEFSSTDLKTYIESFALLLGSIGTFLTLRQTFKKKKEGITNELLKSSWKNRLLAEGMDEQRAEAIVSSFSNDLKLLLDAN